MQIDEGTGTFTIDMEELEFIDILSISTLLRMNNLLSGTGGSMRICCAGNIVLDFLETLNISAIIPLYLSQVEALSTWKDTEWINQGFPA